MKNENAKVDGRAAWFRKAGWGLFFHYLASPASSKEKTVMTVEKWNDQINAFDVEGLAEELDACGAAYMFITIGQNSGFYLSPNKTYDRLVPRDKSRLSQRDLVQDLAAALDKRGIRLMVYLPSKAPCTDDYAVDKLGFRTLLDVIQVKPRPETFVFPEGTDTQFPEAQRNWEAIIREWSERWGNSIHGWWIDGCRPHHEMYREPEPPNFNSFADAMRAGNPDSIVAFNPGVRHPIIKHADCEDYTAGETQGLLPVHLQKDRWFQPIGGDVDGAQYHLLTFLGQQWGRGAPSLPEGLFIEYTKYLISKNGVLSWDIPPAIDGHIQRDFFPMMKALGKATR